MVVPLVAAVLMLVWALEGVVRVRVRVRVLEGVVLVLVLVLFVVC